MGEVKEFQLYNAESVAASRAVHRFRMAIPVFHRSIESLVGDTGDLTSWSLRCNTCTNARQNITLAEVVSGCTFIGSERYPEHEGICSYTGLQRTQRGGGLYLGSADCAITRK